MVSFVEFLQDDFEITVFCLGDKNEQTWFKENTKVIYSSTGWIHRAVKHKPADNRFSHVVKTGVNVVLNQLYKNPLNQWRQRSLDKLKEEHESQPFDVIISSHAPPEAHLVAADFVSVNTDVPWLADMRDEMSLNPGVSGKQVKHLEEVEQIVNSYAKAITSVSLPILNDFKKICSKVEWFEEVRNGYHHEYLNPFVPSKDDVFRFGFFGKFYGTIKPDYLFQAFEKILKNRPELAFEIHLYGVHRNFHVPPILEKHVFIHESLPYLEAIKKMGEMDTNLLLLPKINRKGVYSGKLFDYISVQKPVLACVDKTDVAADLIRDMEAGYLAEFDAVNEIQTEIEKAFLEKKEGKIRMAKAENVKSLHRKNQVQKLKVLIHKMMEK